jgi:hypothetical protein
MVVVCRTWLHIQHATLEVARQNDWLLQNIVTSVVWQGRVSNARLSDKELRDMGKCPMTPEEVGIMLAALGFSPNTHVYLASHTVSYH